MIPAVRHAPEMHEGEHTSSFTLDISDMWKGNCYRCRKPLADQLTTLVQLPPPGRPRLMADGRRFFLDGEPIFRMAIYHTKCLPPNMFHQFAGSLPARQSPAASSLSDEHDVAGGCPNLADPNGGEVE